jgi:hypothetical protein
MVILIIFDTFLFEEVLSFGNINLGFMLKHQTPGCPYCNHCSGEDEGNAEDFQEFHDFEEF